MRPVFVHWQTFIARRWEDSPKSRRVARSLAQSRLCCRRRSTTRAFWRRGHPSSVSPQGLSSPMLIVIFLSRHCSLLCSPSFLIILSAIYQTMKSQRSKKKKNWTCRFFALWLMSSFLRKKKMFCVFSLFPCRKKKKSLLSVEFIQIISSLGVCFSLFICILRYKKTKTKTKRFSVVNCLERSQSQCISVDPVSVMYVCLTTLGKKKRLCHWMGFQKYKKCRLSYFYNWLYLCILYQWNFFILEIKGFNKKKILEKNKSVWPGGVARARLVPEFDF